LQSESLHSHIATIFVEDILLVIGYCYFNYIHLNQFFIFLSTIHLTHFQLSHPFPVMSLISGLHI
jgi:hypothetical protein